MDLEPLSRGGRDRQGLQRLDEMWILSHLMVVGLLEGGVGFDDSL